MTVDDQPLAPPHGFADAWQAALPQTPEEGEKFGAFLERLDGRAHGALALIAGLLLLIPVKWALPQIAGLLVLVSGWRMFGGVAAPALPFLGGRTFTKARLDAAGNFVSKQTWLGAIAPPRLADFSTGFALKAAAIALIVAGMAALVPSTHFLLGFGLIILGIGLMQRDGAAMLAGVAVSFAASAFTMTLLAGAIAGAPFAAGWAEETVPFLVPAEKTLVPDDHAAR